MYIDKSYPAFRIYIHSSYYTMGFYPILFPFQLLYGVTILEWELETHLTVKIRIFVIQVFFLIVVYARL